ncbi:MAG: NADH-quinone oxidoreductase subunit C [Ignavibacteriae bacterium]|nr:MAG: NADH-quinone oxidoreductase subunit C [Ignavibacteriota bacterium]
MTAQEIFDVLKAKFGDALPEEKLSAAGGSAAAGFSLQVWITIAPGRTKEICSFLRDDSEMQFDTLSCLSGVDYNNGTFGVVYHLSSMVQKHKIVLKAFCTKEHPHIQSVSSVWGTANWHEREVFDLFGVIIDEHPDLRRILLPDDWEGNPLRKDYKVQEFYHGMKVPY